MLQILSRSAYEAAHGGEEGELVTLLADLDISPEEWLQWKHEMLDDGYSMAQIDTMQMELTSVRAMVSELYFKQVRLNTRVKSLLKLREEKLDSAIHVTHATGASPAPEPLQAVAPADAAVQVACVEEVEELEHMAMAVSKVSTFQSVGADDAHAELVDATMPVLEVADKSKTQLMDALEMARESILGVLSPRSASLVLATPPPQSEDDDQHVTASSPSPSPSPQVRDEMQLREHKAEEVGVEEASGEAETERNVVAEERGLKKDDGASLSAGRAPKSALTSEAMDAAREVAGLAAMQDAKSKAAVGEFGAAQAARHFAAAQFALARLDMAAELLVGCCRRDKGCMSRRASLAPRRCTALFPAIVRV